MSEKYERIQLTDGEDKGQDVTNLYWIGNMAIAMSYWNVGIALSFLSTPVSYYLVDNLEADSAMVNTYSAITYLPWCLKIFFGILSDVYPMFGWHRRPWFFLGWGIFMVSNLALTIMGTPGTSALLLLSFSQTMGLLLSDTVADAMIVEATEFEAEENKGRMRTQGYLIRSAGMIIGGLMGSCLYNQSEWGWGLDIGQCFMTQALVPFITLCPFWWKLHEIKYQGKIKGFGDMFEECFEFIVKDAVWVPCMYLYLYNFCSISNPSWVNFLFDGLGFTDFEYGMLATFGYGLGCVGLWAYDKVFFNHGWRNLYLWTTCLTAFFSVLQLCLCYGYTFGMSDFIFATGDNSLTSAVQYIVFMPMCIMFLSMIPNGAEGTLYALITTWQNVAYEVGYDIGTLFECFIPVSNTDLIDGNYAGVIKLTYLCSALQIVPVFFIYFKLNVNGMDVACLPNSVVECQAQLNPENRTYWASVSFHFILIASIVVSFAQCIYVIYVPDAC